MRWISFLASVLVVSCGEPTEEVKGAPADEKKWIELPAEDWKTIVFGGEGITEWNDGVLSIGAGAELSGVQFVGENLPTMPYELELNAKKVSGSDFFCGLTFPVSSREECVSLILGGWGGGTVGISSIDGQSADENETTQYMSFEDGQSHDLRVVVEEKRLRVFLDGESIIDVATEGRKLGLRSGMIDYCAPLGIATFQTSAEIRDLRWRSLAD
jgi:hypothetical protein